MKWRSQIKEVWTALTSTVTSSSIPHASIPVKKDISSVCQDLWLAQHLESGQSSLLHVNVSLKQCYVANKPPTSSNCIKSEPVLLPQWWIRAVMYFLMVLFSTVIQCQTMSAPSRGSMQCSGPLGSSSYNSTCVFTCDEGYVLSGSSSSTLRCEESGNWSSRQPLCSGKLACQKCFLWGLKENFYLVSTLRAAFNVPCFSVLQLFSVQISKSLRTGLSTVEKMQTHDSAMETRAHSPVLEATT